MAAQDPSPPGRTSSSHFPKISPHSSKANEVRIFELQARTLSSFITIFLLGPLFFLITPFYFWRSPGHLFFTYIIPIIPAVLVFDGYVSSLRTRSVDEVVALLRKDKEVRGWNILDGEEMHTWPMGKMTWIVGLKQ